MSFMQTDGPNKDPNWTPAEGYVAVLIMVAVALFTGAVVWLRAYGG